MAIRHDFIESESDGVLYCHHALFVPLLTLLEVLWGENIAFGIEAEPTCHTLIESAGEEARGRLDILITAYKKGADEPAYPILLYEAKAPGSILPEEWAAAYKTNVIDDNDARDSALNTYSDAETPSLKGNSFQISRQLRKYMSGFLSRRIVCGDGQNLVGVRLTPKQLEKCASGTDLSASIFVETRPSRFLQTLFSVALEGLLESGLL